MDISDYDDALSYCLIGVRSLSHDPFHVVDNVKNFSVDTYLLGR